MSTNDKPQQQQPKPKPLTHQEYVQYLELRDRYLATHTEYY